jgi:hypothetical protein
MPAVSAAEDFVFNIAIIENNMITDSNFLNLRKCRILIDIKET